MCDQKENTFENKDLLVSGNFKSCFARSVAVNSQYKQIKTADCCTDSKEYNNESQDTFTIRQNGLKVTQESPIRYRKNNRNSSMDESRRFSCGSIVYRRASMNIPKRSEIPVENIYNQNKIETLQWQLKEVEKSREMYKAVMKEVVTFLEKAHISLELLGKRLNRKKSVPRSKSEHYIAGDSSSSTLTQQSLIDEHLSSWNIINKQDCNPDEIPPEKLSQEAFRLLRTSQSLLKTQETKLVSSETSDHSEEPSDIEFLTQLAKEFRRDDHIPQRTTSFSLSPKLILPENEIRIATAFNRKLSLQLSEIRRSLVGSEKKSRTDSARTSVAESETFSLPPTVDRQSELDPLRSSSFDFVGNGSKGVEKASNSSATTSISSIEDESGFSSLNSFQEVGLPMGNSTGIEDVSAKTVLLKSMLHNNSDYSSINESETSSCYSETTLTAPSTLHSERRYEKRSEQKLRTSNRSSIVEDQMNSYAEQEKNNLSNVKLWQKPFQEFKKSGENSSVNSLVNSSVQVNHQRWHSTPETQSGSQSLKVLWV